MATKSYHKVIDVDVNTKPLAQLRKEISGLQNDLVGLDKESKEYQDTVTQLAQKQGQVADVMNATKMAVEPLSADFVTFKEQLKTLSFNDLKKQLAAMKEQWKASTDEIEKTKLTTRISEVKKEINAQNESIGDFQGNVGKYKDSIVSAFGQMKGAVGGMTSSLGLANTGMTSLLANPVAAVFSAIVLAIKELVKGFKSSKENTDRLNEAFSGFKVVGVVVTRIFQTLAGWVLDAVEAVQKFNAKLSALTDKFAHSKIGEMLGFDKLADKIKESTAGIKELAQAQKDLETARQKYWSDEQDSLDRQQRLTNEIAAAKERASNAENSSAEKLKAQNEAIRETKALYAERIRIAREHLSIIATEHAQTASTKEEMAEERDLARQIMQYEADRDNAMKELNEKQKTLTAEANKEREAAEAIAKVRAKDVKLDDTIGESLKREADEAVKAYTKINTAQKTFDKNQAASAAKQKEYAEEQISLEKKKQQAKTAMVDASINLLGALSEAVGKETAAGKAAAVASAIIQTISGGVKAYMTAQKLPTPQNFIVGAANMAAVLATGYAQVKEILAVNTDGTSSSSASSSSAASSSSSTASSAPSVSVPNIGDDNAYTYTRSVTTNAEDAVLNTPVKAYVVESEATAKQELAAKRAAESTY